MTADQGFIMMGSYTDQTSNCTMLRQTPQMLKKSGINKGAHAGRQSKKRSKKRGKKELSLQYELNEAKQASEKNPCDSPTSCYHEARENLEAFYEEKIKGHNNTCSSSLA